MATGKTLIWDSCRAHIANTVKQHMKRRGFKNIVIPGGLTPYVQAGDLGIYKSFKDKISPIIAAWKISDKVLLRHEEVIQNLQKVDTIINWVAAAWNQVNESVILNSIKALGFGDETEWHIYKHDVYGAAFRNAWLSRELLGTNDTELLTENDVEEDEKCSYPRLRRCPK